MNLLLSIFRTTIASIIIGAGLLLVAGVITALVIYPVPIAFVIGMVAIARDYYLHHEKAGA